MSKIRLIPTIKSNDNPSWRMEYNWYDRRGYYIETWKRIVRGEEPRWRPGIDDGVGLRRMYFY